MWVGCAKSSLYTSNHFTRRRVGDVTNLVVLDGEEDETVGILLEEGLIGLSLLDTRGDLGDLNGLLDGLGDGRVDGLERRGRVLLADGLEVELLDRGIAHLEVLEGGSSLRKYVS
jgi:hypothetical protein